MHNIGDSIVYGSAGVMKIVDIRPMAVGDIERTYYVLEEPSGHRGSQTFVPADNEQLVGAMRPLLSRDEVICIIRSIDEVPEAEWVCDNRARAEKFKRIIEAGDAQGMISMIKAVNSMGVRRNEEGKKNYLADEVAMRKAEHVLYSEFAAVLGIAEEDVPQFILAQKTTV